MSRPSLGLFMSYLCDGFFIFSLILIAINHKNVIKTDTLFVVHFVQKTCFVFKVFVQLLFLGDNVNEESK